jgi:hypothetical protein
LVIERAVPFPQPDPRQLAVLMQGPADAVTLRVYTQAWALVFEQRYPSAASGWSRLDLPDAWQAQANGVYFFSVSAQRGSVESRPQKGALMRLR